MLQYLGKHKKWICWIFRLCTLWEFVIKRRESRKESFSLIQIYQTIQLGCLNLNSNLNYYKTTALTYLRKAKLLGIWIAQHAESLNHWKLFVFLSSHHFTTKKLLQVMIISEIFLKKTLKKEMIVTQYFQKNRSEKVSRSND